MYPGHDLANSGNAWERFVPGRDAPWDLRRVVHLHRRAGFAATWDELQRDLKDGPETAINRLLKGRSRSRGVPDDFSQFADRVADLALAVPESSRLKGWWVYRMLCGSDPLTERLTLMWHNHFATSNLKVNDLALMRRQNETLRSLCRAPFSRLLHAMLRDPALLIWLDAPDNTKVHPNENLGRELMEFFTLGVGHYSEDDVKQSARALTGWRMVGDEVRFIPSRHDPGKKSVFGQMAAFDANTLSGVLLNHPATSHRLAWRLCHEFFGEGTTHDAAIDASGRRAASSRPQYRLGCGDRAPLTAVLRCGQPGQSRLEPDRVRDWRGPGARGFRPAAEYACRGRLVRTAGPGLVLSAQRQRLARRTSLDHHAIGDRTNKSRHGIRPGFGGGADRPARSVGLGGSPRPGAEYSLLLPTPAWR